MAATGRIFLFGGFALGIEPLRPLAQALNTAGWATELCALPDVPPDAETAADWVRQHGVGRHDVLAGWSLGGQVASHLAVAADCRLLTLASNPRFCDANFGMAAVDFAAFVARQQQSPAENLRQFVRLCAYGARDAALQAQMRVWQGHLADEVSETSAQVRWLAHLRWLEQWDTLPVLHAHNKPQWHVLGGKDALMMADGVRAVLPQRADVRVCVLADAAHLLVWSHAVQLADEIAVFLRQMD